jgi:hypothetical protein
MDFIYHLKLALVRKPSLKDTSWDQFTVQFFDKDVLVDDFLAEKTPDAEGKVKVSFGTALIDSKDSPGEELPDLYFKVIVDGKEVYKSGWLKDVEAKSEVAEFDLLDGLVVDFGTFLVGS